MPLLLPGNSHDYLPTPHAKKSEQHTAAGRLPAATLHGWRAGLGLCFSGKCAAEPHSRTDSRRPSSSWFSRRGLRTCISDKAPGGADERAQCLARRRWPRDNGNPLSLLTQAVPQRPSLCLREAPPLEPVWPLISDPRRLCPLVCDDFDEPFGFRCRGVSCLSRLARSWASVSDQRCLPSRPHQCEASPPPTVRGPS